MKKMFILIMLLFVGELFAQFTPPSSYTTHYRFRKWSLHANPGADSINANWNDLDFWIYKKGGLAENNIWSYRNEFTGAFKLTGRDTALTDYVYSKTVSGVRHLYWRRDNTTPIKLDSIGISFDSTKAWTLTGNWYFNGTSKKIYFGASHYLQLPGYNDGTTAGEISFDATGNYIEYVGNSSIIQRLAVKSDTTGLAGRATRNWVTNSFEPILTKGNLTETVTGLQFDNTRQVIGGAATLSLSAGYMIPTTTDESNWNAKESALTFSSPLSRSVNTISLLTNTNISWSGIHTFNNYSLLGSIADPLVADALFQTSNILYWRTGAFPTPAYKVLIENSGTYGISISGNAATATSATSATTATTAGGADELLLANDGTNASRYLLFSGLSTGYEPILTDAGITYNPFTNTLSATTFNGALSGNATTVTNGVYTNATNTFAATNTFNTTLQFGVSGELVLPTADPTPAVGRLWRSTNVLKYTTSAGDAKTLATTTDLSSYALTNQTMYIGTTAVAINRGSGALALTGITSIDGSSASCTGNAATVTNGVYTNANNSLTGNNTTTGSIMLDGEVEISTDIDVNQSVLNKNTLIIYSITQATVTLTNPTDGQFLWVSNDKDSVDPVIISPVIDGVNTTLTLTKGNSRLLRYRASETTWYATQ